MSYSLLPDIPVSEWFDHLQQQQLIVKVFDVPEFISQLFFVTR